MNIFASHFAKNWRHRLSSSLSRYVFCVLPPLDVCRRLPKSDGDGELGIRSSAFVVPAGGDCNLGSADSCTPQLLLQRGCCWKGQEGEELTASPTCCSAGFLLQGCLERRFASAEISHPSMKTRGGFASLQNAILQKTSLLLFCVTPFLLFQPVTGSLHQMKTQPRCGRVLRLFCRRFRCRLLGTKEGCETTEHRWQLRQKVEKARLIHARLKYLRFCMQPAWWHGNLETNSTSWGKPGLPLQSALTPKERVQLIACLWQTDCLRVKQKCHS